MAVLPVRPDAEEADRLDLVELDLIVAELGRAGQPAGQPGLAGALGAWAAPSEQLEVKGRLVPIGPLNREQPACSIGQDVEGPLAIARVRRIQPPV
jgi:hypothetical protein